MAKGNSTTHEWYRTIVIAPGVRKECPTGSDYFFSLRGTKADLLRSGHVLPEWFPDIDRIVRKNGCCEASAHQIVDGMSIKTIYRRAQGHYKVSFYLDDRVAYAAALFRSRKGNSRYVCERSSPAIERSAREDKALSRFIAEMALQCRRPSSKIRSEVAGLYSCTALPRSPF